MISQINIKVNAANPKFPLCAMTAFNGSPSSLRISGIPTSIGNWNINNVRVLVSYPNNLTVEKEAVKVDDLWIATVDGSQTNGVIKNGFQVLADGVDENGLPVNGYVLGVGDVVVLPRDKGIEKLVDRYAVRYLNEPPTTPSIGDMLNLNGKFKVWDGSKWVSVSGDDVEVYDSAITLQANGVEFGSFTVNASEAKTIDIPVPSKVSELNNDIGYITASQVPPVPSKVSELDNDSGYITLSQVPPIPSEVSELENDVGYVTAEAIPSKVSELDNDAGYITMSAIPAIPSKTSELDNDSGFITASALPTKVSELQNDTGFITLSEVPPNPSKVSELDNDAGYITASAIPSDISAFNNDVGYLSAVTWNDVSGKPNIPSNTSDLVNDSGFITANDIPFIPSKTSDLNNDSGFITSAALSGYATENYVDGKVLALSSIYALDSDLDLVVASVSSIQTSLSTYATISYVDSQIGSINTILDNINGEVI